MHDLSNGKLWPDEQLNVFNNFVYILTFCQTSVLSIRLHINGWGFRTCHWQLCVFSGYWFSAYRGIATRGQIVVKVAVGGDVRIGCLPSDNDGEAVCLHKSLLQSTDLGFLLTLHNTGYSLRICQCCFAPVCTYIVVTECYINSHNCRNMSIKHPRTVGIIAVSSTCDYGYLITRGIWCNTVCYWEATIYQGI